MVKHGRNVKFLTGFAVLEYPRKFLNVSLLLFTAHYLKLISHWGAEPKCADDKSLSVIWFAVVRKKRQTRDLTIERFTSCLASAGRNSLEYILKGGCVRHPDWDLRCMLQSRLSILFYYVTCQVQNQVKISKYIRWKCKDVHNSYRSSMCCDFVCQT